MRLLHADASAAFLSAAVCAAAAMMRLRSTGADSQLPDEASHCFQLEASRRQIAQKISGISLQLSRGQAFCSRRQASHAEGCIHCIFIDEYRLRRFIFSHQRGFRMYE
jgi:hypothetical protein